ncbi:MAG TPA: hypothetical protein VGM39_22740 [Kofleriaceae bacterium]
MSREKRQYDVLFIFLCTVALGCGGGGGASGDDDDSTDGVTTGDKLGTFAVELIGPRTEDDNSVTPGYTSVSGKVYDGVTPEATQWTTTSTEGGCSLMTPSVPFCSPACGSTGVCVATNTCAAYPTSQALGTVHIDGVMGAGDLSAVQNNYSATGSLPYPAFAEGDAIKLTASGSDFTPEFTATTVGVAPLAITGGASLALVRNQALALAWNSSAVTSNVHIKLDISHHGGSKGKIECDVADSGSTTISSAIVNALLDLGAAGYPTIIITRSATGHAGVADGHIDLSVSSQQELPITVPGVQSCTEDDQCTAPATCQDDLTCG